MNHKDQLINYIFGEEVVSFGGGNHLWRWTVKRKDTKEGSNNESVHDEHTEMVTLPSDEKLRNQHMTKIMSQFGEKLQKKYPNSDHVTHHHPDSPVGRNHGSQWVDDDNGTTHTYTHHFEKIN